MANISLSLREYMAGARVWLRMTVAAAACLLVVGCDSFLDITPTGMVIPETGEEYRDLLTNAYNSIPSARGMASLRGDELQMPVGNDYASAISSYMDIWAWNDTTADDATVSFEWRLFYHVLYIANYVIEHQGEIKDVKADERSQMVGEAYMLRAYMHFTLVNLYARPYTHCDPATTRGIPLKLDSNVDAVIGNSRIQEVYDQVLADIDLAAKNLNVEEWGSGYTYRWNTLSARCLRSRVLLYMGRYEEALAEAEAVVEAHPDLQDISGSMLPNHYQSVEAIASTELIMTTSYAKDFWVNRDFVNLYSSSDLRKTKFFKAMTVSSYVMLKAGGATSSDVAAYRCTFRSAEFYLTAAECAARLGDTEKALAYFEPLIRMRYKANKVDTVIADVRAMDAETLLSEILDDRARELAFEGHRWFDLRRTTRPEIVKTYKDQTFTLNQDDERYTIPIPAEALAANPLLAE